MKKKAAPKKKTAMAPRVPRTPVPIKKGKDSKKA